MNQLLDSLSDVHGDVHVTRQYIDAHISTAIPFGSHTNGQFETRIEQELLLTQEYLTLLDQETPSIH